MCSISKIAGCFFFDDLTHRVFGLEGDCFQVLYHFTMGGADGRSAPANPSALSIPRSGRLGERDVDGAVNHREPAAKSSLTQAKTRPTQCHKTAEFDLNARLERALQSFFCGFGGNLRKVCGEAGAGGNEILPTKKPSRGRFFVMLVGPAGRSRPPLAFATPACPCAMGGKHAKKRCK